MANIDIKSNSEAHKNFINNLNSPMPREDYSMTFPYFMKLCKLTNYEDMLLIDLRMLYGLTRDYIVYLKRGKKLAPVIVSCYTRDGLRNFRHDRKWFSLFIFLYNSVIKSSTKFAYLTKCKCL